MIRLSRLRSLLCIAPIVLAACSDSTTPSVTAAAPARAFSYAGHGAHLTAGGATTDTLTVFVVGTDGAPLADTPVRWTVDAAGVIVSSATRTNADGLASAIFAAGTRVGTAHVVGTITGLDPVAFDIVIDPADPSRLVPMASLSDTLAAGQAYTGGGVQVTDTYGNAVANVNFNATLTDADGALVATGLSTSDARGVAAVPFGIALTAPGTYRLQFSDERLTMHFGITVLAPVDSSTAAVRRVRP